MSYCFGGEFEMTETIQQLKEDIAILQEKLQKLEETKSPVEEAYKDAYGEYPMGEPFWIVFKKGYEAHQSLVDDANKIKAAASMINCIIEGNPPNGCSAWSEWFELFGSKGILHHLRISAKEYQPKEKEQKWGDIVRESVKWCEEHPDESVEDYLKPHTPDKIEENLREAFQKVQQTEEWKETQRKIDSNYDELVESETSPPEPTSTVFRQKLFDGIKSVFYDPDYERTHWKMKVDMAVDEVLTHFYDILPEPEEYIGDYGPSQGYVDGWNHYRKIIKEKLE
jgi:hypothetical protein